MVPTQNCFWQNIKFSKDQFWGHYYFYSISTIYTRQTFPNICHFAGETNFLYENPSLKDISRRINYDIHINYILGQNLNCWLEDVYSLLIVEKYNTQTSIYSFFFIFAEISQMLLTLSRRRPLSYRNQSIDLLRKSMDWFLYDNGLRLERVKEKPSFSSFPSFLPSTDCKNSTFLVYIRLRWQMKFQNNSKKP